MTMMMPCQYDKAFFFAFMPYMPPKGIFSYDVKHSAILGVLAESSCQR